MHTLPTPHTSAGYRRASSERGFTMPELLVALVITLVVGGSALSAAIHFGRNTLNATGMTDLNQNLRIAMNLVVRDVMQTGEAIPTGGISIPSGVAVLDKVKRPGPTGSDFEFPDEWATIPAVTPGHGLGPIVDGIATDIVTVLRSDVRLPWETPEEPEVTVAAGGVSITFAADFPIDGDVDGIKAGDLIMLKANGSSTLLEVTDVDGQTVFFGSEAESGLNQHNAPGSIMQLATLDEDDLPTFDGVTVVARRILMITYYLDTTGETPALMRRQNYGEERRIALGVENLQFTWNLVDGVDNPANVDEPEAPNTPHQIIKANLHMAARTFDRTTSGDYLHASLNTQIALRSLAFVDRYK